MVSLSIHSFASLTVISVLFMSPVCALSLSCVSQRASRNLFSHRLHFRSHSHTMTRGALSRVVSSHEAIFLVQGNAAAATADRAAADRTRAAKTGSGSCYPIPALDEFVQTFPRPYRCSCMHASPSIKGKGERERRRRLGSPSLTATVLFCWRTPSNILSHFRTRIHRMMRNFFSPQLTPSAAAVAAAARQDQAKALTFQSIIYCPTDMQVRANVKPP